MTCPDCGCDRDNHWLPDPEDGTDERNYMVDPYTCGECCDCDRMFDPGDEIDHAMMLMEDQPR